MKAITMLHSHITAYGFQFLENPKIFIFLKKHKKTRGKQAKKTLTSARVKGS